MSVSVCENAHCDRLRGHILAISERNQLRGDVIRDYIEGRTSGDEAKFFALEMLRLLEGGEPGIIDVATPDEIQSGAV